MFCMEKNGGFQFSITFDISRPKKERDGDPNTKGITKAGRCYGPYVSYGPVDIVLFLFDASFYSTFLCKAEYVFQLQLFCL